jgi:Pyruvate/2-oxoacid:ferredoxin oxidoreductase gamma subunit
MVMLGFLAAQIEFINPEALRESIKSSVRPKTIPLNLEAFQSGYEYPVEKEKVLD